MRRRSVLPTVVGLVAFAGVAVAVYNFGLSDAAKSSIKSAARSAKESFEAVRDVITRTQGFQMEAPDPTANRQAVEQQWARLGF